MIKKEFNKVNASLKGILRNKASSQFRASYLYAVFKGIDVISDDSPLQE